ncbi:conserved hypothetical protein [Alteromonas sp. 38]|uniref:hypothetical protein n=1 Tax=Alteromonas TaxID=226 RepID=UPI0012F2CC9F|nr:MULTISPECIES: hypothetical protein [Alteromonas]CAD5246732.1 conserved hypothetical protein [Alteromonas sp. 154]VXC56398.1 conserved hypothetical protein [Alteromonas sp. 38]
MTVENFHDKNDFISLNVKASVLRKMLSGQNLHVSDIHCNCSRSKQQLQQLLLQAVSGNNK